MVVLQFKTATRNGCIISCAKRAMVAFVHESLNYVAMNPASGMWSCALLKWVTVVVVLNLEGGLTVTVYKQFEDLRPWQIIFACWSDMLRWFETLINSGSNSADMGRRWFTCYTDAVLSVNTYNLNFLGGRFWQLSLLFHASEANAGDQVCGQKEGVLAESLSSVRSFKVINLCHY